MAVPADKLGSLLQEVENEIAPSRKQHESLLRVQDELLARAGKVISDSGTADMRPSPMVVGSVAKGTYLWPCDLDLFLCYPPEVPVEHLEQNGLELAQVLLDNPRRLYASHPYLRGEFGGFETDVVPCYRISPGQNPRTAVDRTPLHTAYVKEHLTREGAGQVRLFKQLCKALGVYGAESAVGGLSGYLCELLVLGYGDLEHLLRGIMEWRPPLRLDGTDEGMVPATSSKEQDDRVPLWVTDPVDQRRNVAAAVSEASLATLTLGARELLDRPRRQLFFSPVKTTLTSREMAGLTARRGSWVATIELERPRGVGEVVGPQVLTLMRQLWDRVEQAGFGPLALEHLLDDEKLMLAMELERGHLPRTKFHPGPHGWRDSTGSFRERWGENDLGKVHLHRGRLVVQRLRTHTSLPGWVAGNIGQISVSQPLKGVLKGPRRVRLWAPGQLPHCPGQGLLTRLLDPGLPWEDRLEEH